MTKQDVVDVLVDRMNGFKHKQLSAEEKRVRDKLLLHAKTKQLPALRKAGLIEALKQNVYNDNLVAAIFAYAVMKKKNVKKPFMFDKIQQTLRILDTPGLRLPFDITVYRGLSLLEQQKSFRHASEGGKEYMLAERNISSSLNPYVSVDFLKKKFSQTKSKEWCCLLVIEVPKGTPCVYIQGLFDSDLVEDEKEVFLPSGEYEVFAQDFVLDVDTALLMKQHAYKNTNNQPKHFDLQVYHAKYRGMAGISSSRAAQYKGSVGNDTLNEMIKDNKKYKHYVQKDPSSPEFSDKAQAASAGGVLFDEDGHVALRRVAGDFGGYGWTFAKGRLDKKETAQHAAVREVREEMGLSAQIVAKLGDFPGTTTKTQMFLMKCEDDADIKKFDDETSAVAWVSPDIAQFLINKFTTTELGKKRDQDILLAASKQFKLLPVQAVFPADLRALTVVKKLGGSTGAALVRDPTTNTRFIRKKYSTKSLLHLTSEVLTDRIYAHLGVPVPNVKGYHSKGVVTVKLATWLDGKSLSNLKGQQRDKAHDKLASNFVIDAWLGNWDVVGLEADNVLVADGIPYRIDNGGALFHRARGKLKKTSAWGTEVAELDWMRTTDSKQFGEVFGRLTDSAVRKQISKLLPRARQLLKEVKMPAVVRNQLAARLTWLSKW